jgi:hypothetical protein
VQSVAQAEHGEPAKQSRRERQDADQPGQLAAFRWHSGQVPYSSRRWLSMR